jgi:ATP-binding cassette, subfamily C (CFTR/MRP), member 1
LAAYTPSIFAPVLTFVIYAIQAKISGSNTLSTNQAFTSLAIITSMTGPAAMLAASIPESAACLGCFERIQKFLVAPSWKDSRTSVNQPRRQENRVSSSNGGRDIELRRVQADQSKSIAHATVSPEAHAESAIIITNLTARPSFVSEPALVKVDIRLRFSAINVLTGPIGSGKSTLLRAILGEIPLDTGSIFVSSNNMAYCAQTPWILNIPIQKSVSGLTRGEAIKEEWYSKVMHACALDKDMLQLADGDQSIPGSRGLTLSGGQKQRVVSAMACTSYTFCGSDDLTILQALARAIYSRRDILVLDDVFSALDSKTEELVTHRLFGPQGLIRTLKTTVVLVTHSSMSPCIFNAIFERTPLTVV